MSHELCVRHLYSGCRGHFHGSVLLCETISTIPVHVVTNKNVLVLVALQTFLH